MSSAIKRLFKTDQTSDHTVRAETVVTREKIRRLQQMAALLQSELDSLQQFHTAPVEQGLDFYTEVSHFEIEIIKRALLAANGHQARAAQLLNLRSNTLNAMIKRYYIQLGHLATPTFQERANDERTPYESSLTNQQVRPRPDIRRRNKQRGLSIDEGQRR